MRPRISAVINTLNEEKNLPFALQSVCTWVDEIVVVDMHSTDRTLEIAREFGARIFLHEPMGFAEPARAFALARATGDWILLLDADEVVPFSLSRRLLSIAANNESDAVLIPWLNYVFGSPLRHTRFGPRQCLQLRFFRRDRVQATAEIHNSLHIDPGARTLALPADREFCVAHFAHLDIEGHIHKLNRYSTIEARQALDQGERTGPVSALIKAWMGFGSYYFVGFGFLDGWRGFYLSMLNAFEHLVRYAKLHQLRVVGPREAIEAHYHREAAAILELYSGAG